MVFEDAAILRIVVEILLAGRLLREAGKRLESCATVREGRGEALTGG